MSVCLRSKHCSTEPVVRFNIHFTARELLDHLVTSHDYTHTEPVTISKMTPWMGLHWAAFVCQTSALGYTKHSLPRLAQWGLVI